MTKQNEHMVISLPFTFFFIFIIDADPGQVSNWGRAKRPKEEDHPISPRYYSLPELLQFIRKDSCINNSWLALSGASIWAGYCMCVCACIDLWAIPCYCWLCEFQSQLYCIFPCDILGCFWTVHIIEPSSGRGMFASTVSCRTCLALSCKSCDTQVPGDLQEDGIDR